MVWGGRYGADGEGGAMGAWWCGDGMVRMVKARAAVGMYMMEDRHWDGVYGDVYDDG